MLALKRYPGQSIDLYYPGGVIRVQYVRYEGAYIVIGIDAPDEVNILRAEVPNRNA